MIKGRGVKKGFLRGEVKGREARSGRKSRRWREGKSIECRSIGTGLRAGRRGLKNFRDCKAKRGRRTRKEGEVQVEA